MTADSTIQQSTVFNILVDDQQFGGAVSVAPGATETKTVPNLDDGVRHIVVMAGEVYELDKNVDVQCDNVPVGNYSNPKGSVLDSCNHVVSVTASNYPIGDNLEGLQPVTFTLTFVANDSGKVQQLDTFTLPSGEDDAFDTQRNYSPGDRGVVSLYADGMEPIHVYFTDTCMIVPDVKHHAHHNNANPNVTTTLPNTGLSVRQWEALLGFAMLLTGAFLVKVSRQPVRVRIKR
jgi:hypothetical protein